MKHPLFTDIEILRSYVQPVSLPRTLPTNGPGQEVAFVTGATGFIGGYLLKTLISKGSFERYICLVRGVSQEQARTRLRNSQIAKGLAESTFDTADIQVVVGDALEEGFGLELSVYQSLLHEVDHFFHFAATMNWVSPFGKDAIANIDAVKRVVSFCAEMRLKKLHYASSMGAWAVLNHMPGAIYEDALHGHGHELPGGYFQSKWVNEQVLAQAAGNELPINIYRIGDVKGDSQTGTGDPNNFGNLVMRYFLQHGVVIASDVPEFNFIPVDYLASAIAHICVRGEGTFQFSNPDMISFMDIYHAAMRMGYECDLINYPQWEEMISRDKDDIGRKLKAIFRRFTPGPGHEDKSFYSIGVEMFKRPHSTQNTDRVLAGSGILCPAMLQDDVLGKYLTPLGQACT